MNELHKNFHSIQINITPHTFAGLAKQNMAFHQGVMELCDNAIAASLPGEKGLICCAGSLFLAAEMRKTVCK